MSSNTTEPLKIAIIGTGYFSHFHFAAWQRITEVEIIGLFTLDEKQAKHFQQQYSVPVIFDTLHALLQSDADVIDVVSPPHSHADIVTQCIQHKKKVICQKPFCQSVDEAIELVDVIRQHNAFVAIHENFRFQPWYRQIKALLDTKKLGTLYEIQFNFRPGDGQGPNAYLERQPYFQTQPHFFIQETGVHFIDVFRYLVGEVSGLFARLTKLNPNIAGEDAGMVVFEFADGIRGILNGNRLSDHAANNTRLTMGEMRIEGSQATLTLNGYGQIQVRDHGSTMTTNIDYNWLDNDFGGDCVYLTTQHIVDHLLAGSPISNLAQDYLRNRIIEDAIYTSSESGQWVQL